MIVRSFSAGTNTAESTARVTRSRRRGSGEEMTESAALGRRQRDRDPNRSARSAAAVPAYERPHECVRKMLKK